MARILDSKLRLARGRMGARGFTHQQEMTGIVHYIHLLSFRPRPNDPYANIFYLDQIYIYGRDSVNHNSRNKGLTSTVKLWSISKG
jgi:hypothetical protein